MQDSSMSLLFIFDNRSYLSLPLPSRKNWKTASLSLVYFLYFDKSSTFHKDYSRPLTFFEYTTSLKNSRVFSIKKNFLSCHGS